MKARTLILTALFAGATLNSALAEDAAPAAAPAVTPAPVAQAPATENLEQKVAEMQQSIEKLKADIQNIQNTRNELQAKLDQSDKDVAAQMKKIEEINNQIAEKQKAADAQAAEKKQ